MIVKIVGILVVSVVAIIGIGLYVLSKMQSAPSNYWADIKTTAPIEKKYNSLGNYTVESTEYDAPHDERDKDSNRFVGYHPTATGTYPLVVIVNGTGIPWNKYKDVFKYS